MRLLKMLSVTSFLLTTGVGEHAVPNFAFVPFCLVAFLKDIINYQRYKEISWDLGFYSIVVICCICIIIFARKYKDKYVLFIAILTLVAAQIYTSEIINERKLTLWFIIPFSFFVLWSVLIMMKSFRAKERSVSNREIQVL